MRKFFTFAALLATFWYSSSAAVYTDVISYDKLLEKSPNAKVTADLSELNKYNPFGANINEDLFVMYMGDNESGAQYSVKNVYLFSELGGDDTKQTFGFAYDEFNNDIPGYYNGNGLCSVVAPEGKYIKSVTASSSYTISEYSPFTVFYSDEPFTFADRWNVNYRTASGSTTVSVNIEEPQQRYVYIVCSQQRLYDITIEWAGDQAVQTVEKPTIECQANPVVPGSLVEVKTATVGATIDVKVAINGVDDDVTRTFTQANAGEVAGSFNLPGNAGDVITVTAVGIMADWTDSEIATQVYTLEDPSTPPSGGFIDVINYEKILEKAPSAKLTTDLAVLKQFESFGENINENLDLMYTGENESGAQYSLKYIYLFDATNETYTKRTFGFPYDYTNGVGLYVVAPGEGKYIKSVTISSGAEFEEYYAPCVFYSDKPFTYAERYDVSYKSDFGSKTIKFEIDEPAQYLYIFSMYTWNYDYTIEWTDEKPIATVATPTIECWADPLVPGSSVEVNTATIGATIDVKVAINGEDDGETRTFTKEYDYLPAGNFNLPGKPGDVVTVTAVATKADWNDSEMATETYTIANPLCPNVLINNSENVSYFVSGKPIKLSVAEKNEKDEYVDIAGAKITYKWTWNKWDDNTNGSSDGETTVDAPYDFTLPADIPVGAYLSFTFKQEAPGYSPSESYGNGEIVSQKIEVPTLNASSYTDVEKGTAMALNKPRFADKLYYIVNDGEEQMTENNYEFTVEEDMTIEAWATGEGFDPSDKVTYEITVEKLDKNIDVLRPLDNEQSESTQTYFDGEEHNGANKYLFNGGFWKDWNTGRHTFYHNNSYTNCDFLANLTAGEYVITGIRIDSPGNGACAAVYLADEPLATVDDEGNVSRAEGVETNIPNYSVEGRPGYFVICASDYSNLDPTLAVRVGDFNEWIDMEDAQGKQLAAGFVTEDQTELSFENHKYFLIRPWGANGLDVYRYLIRYSSDPIGTGSINAVLDTEAEAVYYNLNGMRVDGRNLAPGLYIRVTPASTSKILVK